MDQFLRGRLKDPRFQLHGPEFEPGVSASSWKETPPPASGFSRGIPSLIYEKDNAQSQGSCWDGYHRDYSKAKYSDNSCVKDGAGKKKKRRKKTSGSGSESVTSSESDGEGGRKKKAKAPKKNA